MALEVFDLPAVFACAVELGRVLASRPDWETLEANDVDLLFDRLTKALRMEEAGTIGDCLRRFRYSACSSPARNALKRLAFALAGLNGSPACVQAGRLLLEQGTWQLWEGMVKPTARR